MTQLLTLALTGHPRTVLFWKLTLTLLVTVITWLALTSTPPQVPIAQWDKLHHALGFTALATAARFGFRGAWLRIGVWLLVFGALIEWLQSLTPHRSADLGDLLADAVGISIGLALATLLNRAAATRIADLPASHTR